MSRTPLERASELPGLELARGILRDAFGVELLLADAEGALAHQKGGVRAPPCSTCRDILFTPEGFRRCDAFYRQFDPQAPELCHAGFHAIGAVSEEGVRLIVSGLRGDEAKATLTPDARRSVSAILALLVKQLDAQSTPDDSGGLWGLTGRSPQMQRVYRSMRKLAASDATVLVLGESGTGKELVSRALHENGPRQRGPFVAQNCAALPENLLESMLFGHVRGAFSGADRPHDGLFASAAGGTLFLDEIGETSPAFQARLLRVVQDGSYVPLGSTKTHQADVRIIAATHRDLRTMISAGTFREDLFYRLNVLSLALPPLRSRSGDVEYLCAEFVQEFGAAQPDSNARQCIQRYDWPGNVRELRAEVQRWAVQHPEVDGVESRHLSMAVQNAAGFGRREEPLPVVAHSVGEETPTLAGAVSALEKELIEQGLLRTKGKKAALARQLGISRTTLNERLKRYGLE
ncbi:MAG: sigma-54 interaction domain-containing protein [Polyangiales bacterium]